MTLGQGQIETIRDDVIVYRTDHIQERKNHSGVDKFER